MIMDRYLVKDVGLTRKAVFDLCLIDCGMYYVLNIMIMIMAILTRGVT